MRLTRKLNIAGCVLLVIGVAFLSIGIATTNIFFERQTGGCDIVVGLFFMCCLPDGMDPKETPICTSYPYYLGRLPNSNLPQTLQKIMTNIEDLTAFSDKAWDIQKTGKTVVKVGNAGSIPYIWTRILLFNNLSDATNLEPTLSELNAIRWLLVAGIITLYLSCFLMYGSAVKIIMMIQFGFTVIGTGALLAGILYLTYFMALDMKNLPAGVTIFNFGLSYILIWVGIGFTFLYITIISIAIHKSMRKHSEFQPAIAHFAPTFQPIITPAITPFTSTFQTKRIEDDYQNKSRGNDYQIRRGECDYQSNREDDDHSSRRGGKRSSRREIKREGDDHHSRRGETAHRSRRNHSRHRSRRSEYHESRRERL